MTYSPGTLTANTLYRQKQTDTYCSANPTTVVYTYEITITVNQLQKIYGTFNYNNVLNTPLTHLVHVALYKHSDNTLVAETDISNGTGYYEFPNLCPDCTYDIVATSSHPSAGSVNSTDAAQVNYWGPHPYKIANGRFYAGDVRSNDNFLGANDAKRLQDNFVLGTSFDKLQNWVFWKVGEDSISTNNQFDQVVPSVYLAVNNNKLANMSALCTGDFNRSFNPSLAKARSTTLDLVYTATKEVKNNEEFDLPIRMVNANTIGAVSLIFNFPANLVEVQDVIMNSNDGQLDWAVNGNELRIGWNSQTPMDLGAAANLLTLRLKTTNEFTNESSIMFALAGDPLNELANGQYNVIDYAVISLDMVNSVALGVTEQKFDNTLILTNHPNPFNSSTMINYELPFDGKVTLEVYNYLGTRVSALVNESQLKGNHNIRLDASSLPSGIYMATLTVKNADKVLVRTIKLVYNH